jgi:hypothetical protein
VRAHSVARTATCLRRGVLDLTVHGVCCRGSQGTPKGGGLDLHSQLVGYLHKLDESNTAKEATNKKRLEVKHEELQVERLRLQDAAAQRAEQRAERLAEREHSEKRDDTREKQSREFMLAMMGALNRK